MTVVLYSLAIILISALGGLYVSGKPKERVKIWRRELGFSKRYYLDINGNSSWIYEVGYNRTRLYNNYYNEYTSGELKALIEMNEHNPKETIDRFHKLMVLK